MSRPGPRTLLFVGILAIGVFARAWELRQLPPGLNADEASIGVEAYDLGHFGLDRNAISFPVHFIAWGSGQNALYGYLLIPFVWLLGLSPLVVRLPMALAGVASLPLMYWVGATTFSRRVGLIAMFCLAISPWHIMLSRWGLESNILPFVLLCVYTCLLLAIEKPAWIIPACVFSGLSLYAYGTAYAVAPVFMIVSMVALWSRRALGIRHLAFGAVAFCMVAAPIFLFLLVNTLPLPQLSLGPVTIPRLPTVPRYVEATILGQRSVLAGAAVDLWTGARLLATETDGIIYNVIEPFGIFYRLLLPTSLLGLVLLARGAPTKSGPQHSLLLAWLGAALLPAILQPVNINRFNAIFLPLLLCGSFGLSWLAARFALALPLIAALLLAAFLAFTVAYHGTTYRKEMVAKFHQGLLTAFRFAQTQSDGPLCITNQINMPYIFALFSAPTNPAAFVESARYVDPTAPFRQVLSYGRYVFGRANCVGSDRYTYVLTGSEIPPRLGNRYAYEFFDGFVVYYPRPETAGP